MPPIPPFILIAIAAVAAAIPIAIGLTKVLAPVAREYINSNIDERTARQLRDAVHNAFQVVAAISRLTTTTLDDGLAQILQIADQEFQAVRGRPMTPKEKKQAAHLVLALHADPAVPSTIGSPSKGELIASAAVLARQG